MQPTASHLSLSRHGIWYFRWRVPADVRARHPELPKELKRSTKTADTRRARALAREMYCAFLLRYGVGFKMSSFRFSGFTVKRDPVSAVITEVTTDASDTPESLAMLARMIEQNDARETLPRTAGTAIAYGNLPAAAGTPAPASEQPPSINGAIDRWHKFQVLNNHWTENTAKYVHLPSLHLLREMVGTPAAGPGPRPTIDLPLAQLTRTKLETFIDEFWRFPGQKGKRHADRTAREIFEAGGTPQSSANVYKRLGHIHLFLKFCRGKGYLSNDVVREVELVLEANTARSQERAAEAKAGEDGVSSAGYVSFTEEELGKLFGAKFVEHVELNAARYWIPLLSRFTGLRVNEASQLRPADVIMKDGVRCIQVKGEVSSAPQRDKQRLKSKSSRRIIPLHPALIDLGFLDYVQERLLRGADWMWDGLLWTAKSGFGKYPSRDFNKLAKATHVNESNVKVFHSFRSTISQELSKHGLESELIDQFLGHNTKSIRREHYGRTDDGPATPVQRVFQVLKLVEPGFNVQPWQAVQWQPPVKRKYAKRRTSGNATAAAQPFVSSADSLVKR